MNTGHSILILIQAKEKKLSGLSLKKKENIEKEKKDYKLLLCTHVKSELWYTVICKIKNGKKVFK